MCFPGLKFHPKKGTEVWGAVGNPRAEGADFAFQTLGQVGMAGPGGNGGNGFFFGSLVDGNPGKNLSLSHPCLHPCFFVGPFSVCWGGLP